MLIEFANVLEHLHEEIQVSLSYVFNRAAPSCCSTLLSASGDPGAFSRDFTTNLSPQCRAFNRALKTEKLNSPLGGWAGACIQMTDA